ncbi:MAG: hypothetical protein V4696_07665 [Pseudomonadota bacterium]
MMILLTLAVSLFGFTDAAQQPSRAYRELVEETELAAANDPCQRRTADGWETLSWRDCLPFGPPQRMHGVGYYGFEESGFVPDVRSVPLVRRLGQGPWRSGLIQLDVGIEQVMSRKRIALGLPCTTAIAIEFVGRRAVLPDSLQVRPTAEEVIVVDRVIDVKRVGIVRTVGTNKVCPKRKRLG